METPEILRKPHKCNKVQWKQTHAHEVCDFSAWTLRGVFFCQFPGNLAQICAAFTVNQDENTRTWKLKQLNVKMSSVLSKRGRRWFI